MTRPLDRAALLARNILDLVETTPAADLLVRLEDMVRDELADIKREIAGDREIPDA